MAGMPCKGLTRPKPGTHTAELESRRCSRPLAGAIEVTGAPAHLCYVGYFRAERGGIEDQQVHFCMQGGNLHLNGRSPASSLLSMARKYAVQSIAPLLAPS